MFEAPKRKEIRSKLLSKATQNYMTLSVYLCCRLIGYTINWALNNTPYFGGVGVGC